MSTTLRHAAAFLILVLAGAPLLAYSEEKAPVTAEQLLAEAIAGENLADSGRLCFRLEATSNLGSPVMMTESTKVDSIDYTWAPGGKFRIAMTAKGELVREIVSDGKAIETGGKIWDARFAFDYNRHPTEDSQELRDTLYDQMWVYNRILRYHLRPLSGFGIARTVDNILSGKQVVLTTPDPNGKGGMLQLTYTSNPRAHEFLEIAYHGIAYARTNQPPAGGGFSYERTAPVEIGKLGWIPARCVVVGGSAEQGAELSFRRTTELCPVQPQGPVDPADFVVDYDKTSMISWPYGSRMKNFFYGIVNTVKDSWERVADGEIGD